MGHGSVTHWASLRRIALLAILKGCDEFCKVLRSRTHQALIHPHLRLSKLLCLHDGLGSGWGQDMECELDCNAIDSIKQALSRDFDIDQCKSFLPASVGLCKRTSDVYLLHND